MKKNLIITVLFAFVAIATVGAQHIEIKNPYEHVNWATDLRLKSNLHTHTTQSDGWFAPQHVVDYYQELGYDILSVTDHNTVTYPWSSFESIYSADWVKENYEKGKITEKELVYENRNAKEMGLFDIQGNEITAPHHMGSFFNDYCAKPNDEYVVLEEIEKRDGLALLNHPGRYTETNPEKYSTDWYVDIFKRFSLLTGMEVYNQADRYPTDRIHWDKVLTKSMPERPIWGYSNDDFHGDDKRWDLAGRNWNLFLLPKLDEAHMRTGMLEGRFLYIYAYDGHNGPMPPRVKSISVDQDLASISIDVSGQDSTRWISNSRVVAYGNTINLKDIEVLGGYVRAEIYAPGSVTGTQPFGIVQH